MQNKNSERTDFTHVSLSRDVTIGGHTITFTLPESFRNKIHARLLEHSLLVAKEEERRAVFQALKNAILQEKFSEHLLNIDNEEYRVLVEHIQKICNLVASPLSNLSETNKHILFAIRQALQTAAYQKLKTHEADPCIHFLHAVCLASYAEPRIFHAFSVLGEHLGYVTAKESTETEFYAFLKSSRSQGRRFGLITNDRTLKYVWKHFTHLKGAFLSTKWGRYLISLFGLQEYDPRGNLENNAGALFSEEIKTERASIEIRTICTPSPTIGNSIAPEAHAILQAMENRWKMSQEELQRDPYPYLRWSYVNLQNINSKNEGPRARAIMHLQIQYPNAFRAISVAVDTSFYRANVYGKNEKYLQAVTKDASPLDEEYKQHMQDELLSLCNEELEGRIGKEDSGFYFPSGWIENEKRIQIIEKAFRLVQQSVKLPSLTQEKWNWYQKAAFRELVLLGIMKYHQIKAAIELPSGKLLSTFACKECIDRGGKTNACFLWALGKDTPELHKHVFSAFHARALLSRRRMVLPQRVEPMIALALVVSRDGINKFLTSIATACHVELHPAEPII